MPNVGVDRHAAQRRCVSASNDLLDRCGAVGASNGDKLMA